MPIEISEKLYTVEELLNLNLPDDAELIEGKIVRNKILVKVQKMATLLPV